MLIYTVDESIKQKLLDNKQVLKKEKELNGTKVYIFYINDVTLLSNKVSKEENSKIKLVSNRFTF